MGGLLPEAPTLSPGHTSQEVKKNHKKPKKHTFK